MKYSDTASDARQKVIRVLNHGLDHEFFDVQDIQVDTNPKETHEI